MRRIPRRYVALGLIVVAIVLLGALVIVRDNVRARPARRRSRRSTRRPRRSSRRWPRCPPPSTTPSGTTRRPSRSPPRSRPGSRSCGRRPTARRAARAGRLLLRRRVRALRRRPSAGRSSSPCRASARSGSWADAVEPDARPSPTCPPSPSGRSSTRARRSICRRVERYSALNPTGARLPRARDARRPAGRGGRPRTTGPGRLRRCSTWPTAGCSAAPASRPVLGRTDPVPDRGRPDVTRPARDPGRRGLGQRDHGGHLLGRSRPGPGAVCEQPRRRWRPTRLLKIDARAAHSEPSRARRQPDAGRWPAASHAGRQLARRSSTTLRSTSFSPPQMPCGSRIRMA